MRRPIIFTLILFVGIALGFFFRELLPGKPVGAKVVRIESRGLSYHLATKAKTVGEALAAENFQTQDSRIVPDPSASLTGGMTIEVAKALTVNLVDGGNRSQVVTHAATVGDFLFEQKIALAATDRVTPDFSQFLGEGMTVTIDRIVDLEVVEAHDIPFEIIRRDDPLVFYGQAKILTPGILGQKEQTFLITYKNGVEIKRKLEKAKVLEKPHSEIRDFGTKIMVQETRDGRASWYAFRGCMCAAHPFYAKGRFVRVTSEATGKSIIVEINDLGPDLGIHPDRIIDLDSVAFKQLAPLNSGTLGVRVELLQDGN
jgi:hypothetical protein